MRRLLNFIQLARKSNISWLFLRADYALLLTFVFFFVFTGNLNRIGAKSGIAAKAMERINEKVGRQIVVGAHSPSFGFEKKEQECEDIIEIVNKSGANVLLVGVGAPKQEKWIMRYRGRMPNVKLFMALGATIDFEAGTLKRAPMFWQKIGMEWLYRVLKEPRRLFKRYFIDDMQFFFYYVKQLLGLYKDPFLK